MKKENAYNQECVVLMMWNRTNANNPMIMRTKIQKTLRNRLKKIKKEITLLVLQRTQGKPNN